MRFIVYNGPDIVNVINTNNTLSIPITITLPLSVIITFLLKIHNYYISNLIK